jgi:putative FmdB family regulatory protein
MPTRVYVCLGCGHGEERAERWADAGPAACPACGAPEYRRVIHAPQTIVRGGRLVDEERRFVRPRVVQNRDGSETAYTSLQEARRGEYERAAGVTSSRLARTLLARKNARVLASGMLPGRDSTNYRLACEERPR